MKHIFALNLILLLASCSRYHAIPRASEKGLHEVRSINLIKFTEPAIYSEILKEETVKKESRLKNHIESYAHTSAPDKKIVGQSIPLSFQKTSEKKAPSDSVVTPKITSNEKYDRLRKYILSSTLVSAVGLLFYTIGIFGIDRYAALIFGGIILSVGLMLLSIFILGYIISYFSDLSDTEDEPAKDEPAKDEPAKDEPAKDEPAKENIFKPKKTRQPANSPNYLFFYFLIANLIIWALTKLKIK